MLVCVCVIVICLVVWVVCVKGTLTVVDCANIYEDQRNCE